MVYIFFNEYCFCRSIGLSTIVGPATVAALSSVPDFLLAETCYAYCQMHSSNRLHRYPKYRNTFVLAEGSSLTLKCAEATVDTKVYYIFIYRVYYEDFKPKFRFKAIK